MKAWTKTLFRALPLVAAATFFVGVIAVAQDAPKEQSSQEQPEDASASCIACHSEEAGVGPVVDVQALKNSPHASFDCQTCHASITDAPHTPAMLKEKPTCGNCHPDEATAFKQSMHSNRDFVKDDHPSCVFCHGSGNPHAITAGSKWTRKQKVEVCTQCHGQTERMKRYHVDPDAVASYNESFHGKALLRFGNLKVAICTDCHRHHDVLSPMNPAAPTHRANAAKTCGQTDCHIGAKVDFAMSGANHLRLKVKDSPPLQIEELLFKLLTGFVILFLLLGVVLDIRKELSHKLTAPAAGRFATFVISFGYLFVIVTLLMGVLGISGARWAAMIAIGMFAVALLAYIFRPNKLKKSANGARKFQRFTVAQRIQHVILAVSFIGLVITGMPLRYPQVDWLRNFTYLIGGLEMSRTIHRVSAVAMIAVWLWHTVYLFYRWYKAGFTFKSWTMWPGKKDLQDLLGSFKYYFGLSNQEPRYDRFQFREKFDYFAVYWGMPIMVFSGLVLWFPLYFGNRLPEVGIAAALIAHGDEAVLAFLAIILWHFYNTHFTPEHFPMSKVWITGTMTEDQMSREHPLELARMKEADRSNSESPEFNAEATQIDDPKDQ